MEVGDIVTVLQITQFTGTKKIPAIVEYVDGERFDARAISGTFDADGHSLIALQMRDRGRTWE